MISRQFCYIAGTGRIGSHWIDALLVDSCSPHAVVTFHDGFNDRASASGCRDLREFWSHYALRVMSASPLADAYVACNPALLEHVALSFGVPDVLAVLPGQFLCRQPRRLFIVREPVGYVESLLSLDYMWRWWTYPRVEEVYDLAGWRAAQSEVERLAWGWVLKNRFYAPLIDAPGTLFLRFEELFGDMRPAVFAERIAAILAHFGLESRQPPIRWWTLRAQRQNASQGAGRLSAAERDAVLAICRETMEMFW